MLGGYQIIDLRKIGLELKGSQQTISDAGILSQLRGLRNYIEKGHAYAKPLDNALKPILIRYRDQKNNEKREVSSFASINNTNNSLTFTIVAKHIQIEVVFEEKTDDDGNKYYDIKTAKYLYNKNEIIEGNLDIAKNLSVGEDAQLEGDLTISGNVSVDETSEVQIFENIVDKDGHRRFVDGDITIETIEGITQNYAKWSLSGSHLLIVIAISISNTTSFDGKLADINLPAWVKSKIVALFSSNVIVGEYTATNPSDATGQSLRAILKKQSNNVFVTISNFTASKDRITRISYDLLIDNE